MPSTTNTDICNLALGRIKQKQITTLNPPGSEIAKICLKYYDDARREVLRSHPWGFAIKRISLASLATDPDFEFEKQYKLPNDFIRLVAVYGVDPTEMSFGTTWIREDEFNYSIEDGKILCNEASPLKIKYIYDNENVARYDPLFVTALSLLLASKMAYETSGNRGLVSDILAEYDRAMVNAKSVDGQDRPSSVKRKSRWILHRQRTG
jgi:hypothetical protein